MDNKHYLFKDNISKALFSLLEEMYKTIKDDTLAINENIEKYILNDYVNEMNEYDKRYKIGIIYIRYCIAIKSILDEYSYLDDETKKELIEYYIWDNRLKEIKFNGLSWYYDYKFKKSKSTLYKGSLETSDWYKIRKGKLEGQQGINALQSVVRICREHMNMGGNVTLSSYSKCFGVDLFKYIALYPNEDNWLRTYIYIKRNADINIIKDKDEIFSLQKFIRDNKYIDNCNFIIDFSTPRNDKREYFYKWYMEFMSEKFNSHTCNQSKEKENELGEVQIQDILHIWFEDYENRKQVSKMVSPVSDREVIVSENIWGDPIPYNEDKFIIEKNEYEDDDKCICFGLVESELIQLIYNYYREYMRFKYKVSTQEYDIEFERLHEKMLKSIQKEAESKGLDYGDILNKLKDIQLICKVSNNKVRAILSFINWKDEKISLKSTYNNIYNKNKENAYINFFKCVMIDTVKTICFTKGIK